MHYSDYEQRQVDIKSGIELDRRMARGKFIGMRQGTPVVEAEHFIRCGACGGLIDCRDLGQVFEHEGPLPHPSQDQPQ